MSLTADLVYVGGRFRRNQVIRIDEAGRISAVDSSGEADLVLTGQAVIPGFINGHSHAFQRSLRGRTATRPPQREDHFWTWREEMYALVRSLTPESIYAHSLSTFREMVAAGYTAVGEFHYVHADASGGPYSDPNSLARRVVDAARVAGLRIVLLNVFYARGGLRDEPLSPAQQRFACGSLDDFLERSGQLQTIFAADAAVSVGLAAHSFRAVPAADVKRIHDAAETYDWPFHIHLSEQILEVQECEEVYGRRPIELVAELGALGDRTTGVHCTHATDREIDSLADSGATVCACPTTEADLGDGFLRGEEMHDQGIPISLGSDSQVRIDPFEEMRAVEYHERLRHRRRNVLAAPGAAPGDHLDVASELLGMATLRGAHSLRIEAGELAAGRWADMVAIDLGHPLLAGYDEETLAARLALSSDPRVVAATYVAGRRIYESGALV